MKQRGLQRSFSSLGTHTGRHQPRSHCCPLCLSSRRVFASAILDTGHCLFHTSRLPKGFVRNEPRRDEHTKTKTSLPSFTKQNIKKKTSSSGKWVRENRRHHLGHVLNFLNTFIWNYCRMTSILLTLILWSLLNYLGSTTKEGHSLFNCCRVCFLSRPDLNKSDQVSC